MTATVATFREAFPEFASQTNYPSDRVQMWLDVAVKMVNEARWGSLTDFGVHLYTAHHLAVQTRAIKAGAFGNVPGQTSGVLSSKSADGVSASYDTSVATLEGEGHWNLTVYGTMFRQHAKLMGIGPLSIEGAATGTAGAWSGPPLSNY